MASTGALPLSERADIHKSCKSLETLLGVLNDYCEAAAAVALLQKRLAKALRETAGLKVTGEIPANAMNIGATIFETLSDIDTKFAKFADKEYDGISSEVRKWFKKLAKEEKVHDEKIANMNARIKQAGQTYEKKSKKNSRDASEEHFRYINLISTLGPEVSMEKHNHALQVTQRHIATMYSVAACLARMADSEWLRSCEGVRRFASFVGKLGEWRVLCEGGWMGAIPQGLPDDGESEGKPRGGASPIPTQLTEVENADRIQTMRESTDQKFGPSPNSDYGQEYPSTTVVASPRQQYSRSNQSHPPPSLTEQTQNYSSSSSGPPSFQDQQSNVAYDSEKDIPSGATLAAFPAPPTHIPHPLPPGHSHSLHQQQFLQPETPKSKTTSPLLSRSLESSARDLHSSKSSSELHDSPISLTSSEQQLLESSADPKKVVGDTEVISSRGDAPRSRASFGAYSTGNSPSGEREFGVRVDNSGGYGRGASRSVDTREKLAGISRSDTAGSSGSLVAAMRHRYSSQAETTSPISKDVPRLPLSVTNLASRYRPLDELSPPRQGAVSPPNNRQLPRLPLESPTQPTKSEPTRDRTNTSSNPSLQENDPHRIRRQRIDETAEMELREKERELQAREREIETRTRELERERAHLMNARAGDSSSRTQGSNNARPSPSPTSRQRSQIEFPTGSSQQPRSSPHLAPPPASSSYPHAPSSPRHQQSLASLSSSHSQSRPPSPARQPHEGEHAPYCGCAQCSVVKYRSRNASPSPHDLRPPEKPINLRPTSDKPKGWMRRLSMPIVGNAFSLESKKSSPTLRGVLEDGRIERKSYESSNRSVTNLGR